MSLSAVAKSWNAVFCRQLKMPMVSESTSDFENFCAEKQLELKHWCEKLSKMEKSLIIAVER